MAAVGHFKSMDQAIRHSLWNEPDQWIVGDFNRFIEHADGLKLVKPVTTNRWSITEPLGYVRVTWWTNFTINAMLHGDKLVRPMTNGY